jgi:hypothetical protein
MSFLSPSRLARDKAADPEPAGALDRGQLRGLAQSQTPTSAAIRIGLLTGDDPRRRHVVRLCARSRRR